MAKQKRTITVDGLARMTQQPLFYKISPSMQLITDELNLIRKAILKPHDLRARVERLEKKIGLR